MFKHHNHRLLCEALSELGMTCIEDLMDRPEIPDLLKKHQANLCVFPVQDRARLKFVDGELDIEFDRRGMVVAFDGEVIHV